MNKLNWINTLYSTVSGYITVALSYFIGLDNALLVLVILAAIDYITGITAAIFNKELCSSTCYWGIAKKILMLFLIGVANLIGKELGVDLRIVAISFYTGCEGISIIENCAKLGLPIPQKVLDVLKQLKGTGEESDKNESK